MRAVSHVPLMEPGLPHRSLRRKEKGRTSPSPFSLCHEPERLPPPHGPRSPAAGLPLRRQPLGALPRTGDFPECCHSAILLPESLRRPVCRPACCTFGDPCAHHTHALGFSLALIVQLNCRDSCTPSGGSQAGQSQPAAALMLIVLSICAAFLSMAWAEQYFVSLSSTARSTDARSMFLPVSRYSIPMRVNTRG